MAQVKQRHGCLTAWLVVVVIANGCTLLLYMLAADPLGQDLPLVPRWVLPLLTVLCVVRITCTVAVFLWRRWGFFGFVAVVVVEFSINLVTVQDIVSAVLGLVGLATLYGVLHIGGDRSGWRQLE